MISQFIQGSKGSCYLSVYLPQSTPSSWVLCFPPFAEEQNKSRKMMAIQARSLVAAGFAVVIPDLYGTGDSAGDFADADWIVWRNDMLFLIQWIQKMGGNQVHFWGIRLGALLALDVHRHTDKMIASFLLWQPICNGQLATTQFLRLRMVAGLMGGHQEKVSELRDRLQQGNNLEIAGYEVTPDLIENIDKLSAQDLPPSKGNVVHWLELGANIERPLPVQSRKTIERWQEAGTNVHAELIDGDTFWTTQEISVAPELIRRSTELLLGVADPSLYSRFGDRPKLPFAPESSEIPVMFECQGSQLPGILHPGFPNKERGVLVVVGGPQYRVGSHRQFVLLARTLSAEGIPVFRFDYRGMGDGDGPLKGFEAIGDDIRSAIDCFQEQSPGLKEIVIWGLCDAATAASFYAHGDNRVCGLALLNPWVRSEEGEAKTYIRHYYLRRLLSQDFWRKVFSGRFQALSSLKSFVELFGKAIGTGAENSTQSDNDPVLEPIDTPLAFRMEKALERFDGKVLLILSGNDLTAAEFNLAIIASTEFQKILKRKGYRVKKLGDADHTFSKSIWRDAVSQETLDWLSSW